jgi:hypothetical protein
MTLVGAGVTGAAIVNGAMQWIGVPYLYGGGRGSAASARLNGLDCSALVYQVFMALGVNPGTDTVSQFNNPAAVTVPSLAAAQPGDLVFFGSPAGGTQEHVGIYLGANTMIDAPHTGTTVGVHSIAGYGPILGIKRLTASVGTGLPAGTDPTTGAVLDATSATDTSSSSSIGTTISRLLIGLVCLGLALALVGLGVHTSVKTTAKGAAA